jgi:hypothetical protein
MAKHKLLIDDFFSDDFELIAIHTVIEDSRLAYFLNKNLPVLLVNNIEEISISTKNGEGKFSWFQYEDQNLEVIWNLVSNKAEVSNNENFGLFLNDAITVYLLPELSRADYLLKIENTNNSLNTDEILNKLRTIDQISTCYLVNKNEIKSINNLIF